MRRRRPDQNRVCPAGQQQFPGIACNRVADQGNRGGTRRRRVHRRHAGRDDRQLHIERSAAAAEHLECVGSSVGRIQARRIGIDLGGQRVEHSLEAGSVRHEAVAADSGARCQFEHPDFAGPECRGGGIQCRRCGYGRADGPGRVLGERRVGREGGTAAVNHEQFAVARACGERRRIRIGRVVDQRRKCGGDFVQGRQPRRGCRVVVGIDQGHGIAHRCVCGADGELDAELVAGAHRASHRRSLGRGDRGGGGQRPGRCNGIGGGERRAGAVDDEHLRAFGDGRDVCLCLGIDGRGQARRNLAQGRQPQPAGRRIAVGIDHGDRVAGRQCRTRAKGERDFPDLARYRRAGQVEDVGVGGRHGPARDYVARRRMHDFRQRERRRESAAAALDDDQEAAVADRGEVGQFGQSAAVDVGGKRLRHRLAPFAGTDGVDDGGAVQVDTEGVTGHRRARQGGEGRGCGRRRATPRTDRRALRREARTDRRSGRSGNDEARAFGRCGEASGAGADGLRQCLRYLGQRIDDHIADTAQRLRRADRDGEGGAVERHGPDVVRHRRAGQVKHERRRRGRCVEGGRRLDRQRRGEGPGRLLGDEQARALRRGRVVGKAGVTADGGRQRFGDLRQRIRGGADGDLVLDRIDHDQPFVACSGRSGQVDRVSRDRSGGIDRRRGTRRAGRGYRHRRNDGAGGALDDQQGFALDHGGEVRAQVGSDPCRKPGGEFFLRVVGRRIDGQGCRLGADRQLPGFACDQGAVDPEFARSIDAAELDLARRCRGNVGGRKVADREYLAVGTNYDHMRTVGGCRVARQSIDRGSQTGSNLGRGFRARGNVGNRNGDWRSGQIRNNDQRRGSRIGQAGSDAHHGRSRGRRIDLGAGYPGDLERGGEGRAVAVDDHQLCALRSGDEPGRLRRAIEVDRGRQAGNDALNRFACGRSDAEHHAAQGHRPCLALSRGALQGDDGRGRRHIAERCRLRGEGRREAARAAANEDDFRTFDDRVEVVAGGGCDGQSQGSGDVGDGLADARGMRNRARGIVIVEADGPGGADHRSALQRQQGNAGGAVEAGFVGIDDQKVGQCEAVTGAVDHHQRRTVGDGGVVGRRHGIDDGSKMRRGGCGGLDGIAIRHHGVGNDRGQVIADQSDGKGLAHDERRRQRGDARRRCGAGLERAGREYLEDRAEGCAGPFDHHDLVAEGKGGEGILGVGIDRGREVLRYRAKGLQRLRRRSIAVSIHQLDSMRCPCRRARCDNGQVGGPDLAQDRRSGKDAGVCRRRQRRHRTAQKARLAGRHRGHARAESEGRAIGVRNDHGGAVGHGKEACRRRSVEGIGQLAGNAGAGVAGDDRV